MGGPAVAAAGRAGVAQFARAAAARASEIELHGPRHLADVAAAFTLRTSDFPEAAGAGPLAGAADLVAGNVDSGLGAFYGLPEIDVHHVFEVAAFFRRSLRGAALAAEKLRENIAETASRFGAPAAPRAAARKVGEIETAEIHIGVVALSALPRGRRRAGETALGVEAE